MNGSALLSVWIAVCWSRRMLSISGGLVVGHSTLSNFVAAPHYRPALPALPLPTFVSGRVALRPSALYNQLMVLAIAISSLASLIFGVFLGALLCGDYQE